MAGQLAVFDAVANVTVDVVLHLQPVDHLLYAFELGGRVGGGRHRRVHIRRW